ncbi:MAG: TolC family protein [Hoylesella buccalis]
MYYNGTYSVNGSWTVWNGGRNTNTVKLNKLTEKQAALDSATMANQLIEQIAQLYVQILLFQRGHRSEQIYVGLECAKRKAWRRIHESAENEPCRHGAAYRSTCSRRI